MIEINKLNSRLKATRITSSLKQKIGKAIQLFNSNCCGIVLTESAFIRMATKSLAEEILIGKLKLEFPTPKSTKKKGGT